MSKLGRNPFEKNQVAKQKVQSASPSVTAADPKLSTLEERLIDVTTEVIVFGLKTLFLLKTVFATPFTTE
jgi:hypothetical protein